MVSAQVNKRGDRESFLIDAIDDGFDGNATTKIETVVANGINMYGWSQSAG